MIQPANNQHSFRRPPKKRQSTIYLCDQPPAESVRDMLDEIEQSSISQFMVIKADGIEWRLRATTDLNGNFRLDDVPTPWRVTLKRDKQAPVAMVVCVYRELRLVLFSMHRLAGSLTRHSNPGEAYRVTDAATDLIAEIAGREGSR